MVSRMEKVDGEFMTELREIREMKWTGAKSYREYQNDQRPVQSFRDWSSAPLLQKKHIWRKTDKENEGELTS